jgi:hypothetical protein
MKMLKRILLLSLLLLIASAPLFAQSDLCANSPKKFVSISQAATGPLTVIAGKTSKTTYICSIFMLSATQQNINLIESANANCGTPTAGLLGGVTAATGPNLTASQWFVFGDGHGTVAQSVTAGDNVCLISSSTGQISGTIGYVQK